MGKNGNKTAVANTRRHEPAEEDKQQLPAVQEGAEQSKAVAVSSRASLIARMKQDAGKGVSTDAADNLIPLIYLLQSNSPQTVKGHAKRIDGAEAGDIWLRNAPPGYDVVSGDDGLMFQPCHFTKEWVEWQPNRGGFAGRHPWNNKTQFGQPAEATQVEEKGDDGVMRKKWKMPNGNYVVETRYHVGYAIVKGRAFPYTIPLSSTGHNVSKSWMLQMNSEIVQDEEGKPVLDARGGTIKAPSWTVIYRLAPKLQTKGQNSWYQYTVERLNEIQTDEEYSRGHALYEAFISGEKQVAEETNEVDGEGYQGGNYQGGENYSEEDAEL